MSKQNMNRLVTIGAALAVALVVRVAAHEVTVKGTVEAVDRARVQVKVVDAAGTDADTAWFAVTDNTTVKRGDKTVPFAEVKVGESITIVVAAGDEAGIEWTCSMHPEIAEAKPGQCPKCGMTLKQRNRPAKASEIRLLAK